MLYGEFKRNILMEMGEYSANGAPVSDTDNKDYALAMVDATNQAVRFYSTAGNTNEKEQGIAQFNPRNRITDEFLTYYKDDEDLEFMIVGAVGYSFYLGSYGEYVIEEEINGVWTQLLTGTNLTEEYVPYKGVLTPTSIDNNVRVRFIGAYAYPVKWVALFDSKLASYKEFNPVSWYDFNSDYYEFDKVAKYSNGCYKPYNNYNLDKVNNKIGFPYMDIAEYIVYYSAFPVELVFDADNVDSNDNTEVDIPKEYINSAILEVSGKLKANIDKKYGVGDRYQSQAIDQFNAVESNKPRYKEVSNVIDPTERW